jgi:ferritin-like metal-binding protein YciE
MAIENTREAFLYALGDIYDGENHLLDAQQHMFEHATDAELLGVLRPHIAQTERHVMALEDVFHLLGQEPSIISKIRGSVGTVARGGCVGVY